MAKILNFTSTAAFHQPANWMADAARLALIGATALVFGALCMIRVTSLVFDSDLKGRLPSAQTPALLARFESERASFERLAAMAAEDEAARRIAVDHLWPVSWSASGVSDTDRLAEPMQPERWREYRELFARLAIPHGLRKSERIDGLIYFIVSRKGAMSDSYERGYVYCRPRAQARCADLSLQGRDAPAGHPVLEPLNGDGWYAYELHWNG